MTRHSPLELRDFRADDAPDIAYLFFDAVHEGTGTHYTPAQRLAWSGPSPDPDAWRARLSSVICKVAVQDGEVAGFMSLDTTGLIDVAFVAPAQAGTGIAFALYTAIEAEARERAIPVLRTEASLSARPFFLRQGWQVDAQQVVQRNGQELVNFRMSKPLHQA